MADVETFWRGAQFASQLREKSKDILLKVAHGGVADIQEAMRSTTTMPSRRAKTGRVSVPGAPPAIQTGNLVGAIDFDDSKLDSKLRIEVGVTALAPYGVYLEHGTPRVAARPFIEPAAESMQEELDAAVDAMIGAL